MAAQLGIGIVGAGVIGAVHAAAVAGVDGARLVAVADPREDAGRRLADAHGAAWHADDAALVARPDVDAVILATPSGLHADQAVRAAGAGKHVITEKPMAIGLADADRMIAACEGAGVALAVIFQTRFTRDAVRLKRAVEAGLFGRPVIGNAVVHWRRTDDYYAANGGWRGTRALDGGGALMNQSIHTIDLLQWILGPVARLAADTATLDHAIETEDTAAAVLRFASGALGTIQGTTAADRDWPVRLEIVGTEGRAVLQHGALTGWEPRPGAVDADLLTAEDRALTDGWRADEPMGTGHQRQLRAIVAALRSGQEPPVPGREGRKAVELILAIYRAAETGAWVELPAAR